jgi:thiol-disulfide isomerase/thioredoxin
MPPDQVRSIPRDLLAGFLAICGVLAISIYAQFVGSDLRLLFTVTGVAFFLAGLVRGRSAPVHVWLKGLLVSCPGLIGTAALIMNDGLHRFQIPAAVTASAILLTTSGVQSRRLWYSARSKSWLLSVSSVVALALFVISLVPALAVFSSLKKIDRSVTPFAISDPDGSIVRSQDLHGRVVVLAFWATWCLPCHWELPELESVYKHFEHDPDVIFWAVDADWGGETPEKAKRFWARKKFALPWAFDNGGAARALGVDSLPTVVLLDRAGHVRMTHYGYDASEHVDALISNGIQRLLGRPASVR